MAEQKPKPEGYVFGRPTEYRPEFCERVIDWGKYGKSKAWMASALDVAQSSIFLWEKEHPDFSEAMARAMAHSQQWWEDKGQDNIESPVFQASMWSRSMGARFPHDWREKLAHVGGDKTDEPIQQQVTVSADAFTRSITGLAARAGTTEPDGSPDA